VTPVDVRGLLAGLGEGRVAVRMPNWLGDAMFALPAVREVRRLAPKARLELHARADLASVLGALAGLADRVVVASRPDPHGLLTDARSLRGSQACVLLPNSFGSAVPPALARIPIRIGTRTAGRAMLLTHPVEPARAGHLVDYYREVVGASGPVVRGDASVAVRPELTAQVLELTGGDEFAALVPGAAYGPAKRWSGASFAAVGCELKRRGLTPLVIGTAHESALATSVAEACGGRSLAGRTTGAELTGLLAAARVVVANDSGAAHLTAALETPLVAVYGATDPDVTGLATGRHQILYHPAQCSPCGRRRCARPTHECMDGTSPADVMRSIEQLMAGTGRRSAM